MSLREMFLSLLPPPRDAGPGITWITSFPKSGNTWVRQFLYAYIKGAPSQRLNEANRLLPPVRKLKKRVGREKLGRVSEEAMREQVAGDFTWPEGWDPRILTKTHEAYGRKLVMRRRTHSAVLIYRNPRDIIISGVNHFAKKGTPLEDPVAYARDFIETGGTPAWDHMSSWEGHWKSWLEQKRFPVHVVSYENLSRNPREGFSGIIRFLGFPLEENRLDTALEGTTLENLRKLEIEHMERTGNDGNGAFFFNEGKTGQSLDEKFGVEGLDERFDEIFLPRVRRLEEYLRARKPS